MPVVSLDGRRLTDWKAFHAECRSVFGFPDFYGGNLDAWIDCMSGLRDADGMSKFSLLPDEMLCIEILHSGSLRQKAPKILQALEDCAAEVNERCIENSQNPLLSLLLR